MMQEPIFRNSVKSKTERLSEKVKDVSDPSLQSFSQSSKHQSAEDKL